MRFEHDRHVSSDRGSAGEYPFSIAGPMGENVLLDPYVQSPRVLPADSTAPKRAETLARSAHLDPRSANADEPFADPAAQRYDLEFDVVCGRPRPEALARGISAILQTLSAADRVTLNLHVAPTDSWWRWAGSLSSMLTRERNETSPAVSAFNVLGTLELPPEDAADRLIELDLCTWYVWADPTLGVTRTMVEQENAISELAAYGFRVPVLWYLHPANLERTLELSETALEWNLQSGVAVAPIQDHPLWGRRIHTSPLGAAQFARASAALYQRHPYFDDMLQPAARVISRLLRAGSIGWPVRLLIDEDGGVFRFLKIPSAGRRLGSLDDIDTWIDGLPSRLLARRNGLPLDVDYGCQSCPWRYTCRGVDDPAGASHPQAGAAVEWACASWIFWAKSLLRERLAVHHQAMRSMPQPAKEAPP